MNIKLALNFGNFILSATSKKLTKIKYGNAIDEVQSVWVKYGRFNRLYKALGINKKVIKYTHLKNGGENFSNSNIERRTVVTIRGLRSGVQVSERELRI